MFSFPEIANNQFMPYRERYFVCLLLLSWHIFNVTLAFYMGDGAVYCLRTVKIKMCIVLFYDRNFESKTWTSCDVWDILTDCMWSLHTVKEEVLGLNHDFHAAGAAGMSLMIQYLCPLFLFFLITFCSLSENK